jgi:hypothetical protein
VKRLFKVILNYRQNDESFCGILENSLVKHANSIRHFKMINQPITKFISSFVNLNRLELNDTSGSVKWNCLENLSLPLLRVLKARRVPIEVLTSLIKNTNGHLKEIKIDHINHNEINNKCIIQDIYQNCPNLKYLKLLIRSNNILELKNLLISCQYLNELRIIIDNDGFFNESDKSFNWNELFEVLARSSPTFLFDFKFCFYEAPSLKSLKFFLKNWKNRHFMLLKTIQVDHSFYETDLIWGDEHLDLIEKYKAQGIIKKYNHVCF